MTPASMRCATTWPGSGLTAVRSSTLVPMWRTDRAGRVCHWILEVHLTDPRRGFGGFYEELLDIR